MSRPLASWPAGSVPFGCFEELVDRLRRGARPSPCGRASRGSAPARRARARGSACSGRACAPLDLPDPVLVATLLTWSVRVQRGKQLGYDPSTLGRRQLESFLEQAVGRWQAMRQFYADRRKLYNAATHPGLAAVSERGRLVNRRWRPCAAAWSTLSQPRMRYTRRAGGRSGGARSRRRRCAGGPAFIGPPAGYGAVRCAPARRGNQSRRRCWLGVQWGQSPPRSGGGVSRLAPGNQRRWRAKTARRRTESLHVLCLVATKYSEIGVLHDLL